MEDNHSDVFNFKHLLYSHVLTENRLIPDLMIEDIEAVFNKQ